MSSKLPHNEWHRTGNGNVLHLRLGKSWLLTAVLTMAHAGIIAILLIVNIESWIKAVATAIVVCSLVLQVGRSAWRMGASCITALRIGNDGALSVETHRGETLKCEVLPSTFVSSVVTVLNLRTWPERRRVDTVICRDCVDADSFRRLRVWLRWTAHDFRPGGVADGSKMDDA